MNLLFELSKEHPTLPESEVIGVLEGERRVYKVVRRRGNLLLVDVKTRRTDFVGRLALTKRVSRVIGQSRKLDEIPGLVSNHVRKFKSFRVTSSKEIEGKLGEGIGKLGLKVNLENPDVELLCYRMGGYYVGINVPLERDFEKRKPQLRPFFHPTSMHPKIARVLVNLARVKRGEVVLDPFCGTGGILIEAGLMGMEAVGFDIDGSMVEGCKRNLRRYGITGDISVGDATLISGKADAIVTDPPYGRSSFVKGRDAKRLYGSFLENAKGLVGKRGVAVVVVPGNLKIGFRGLRILKRHDLRVHKSLTRRIFILCG